MILGTPGDIISFGLPVGWLAGWLVGWAGLAV